MSKLTNMIRYHHRLRELRTNAGLTQRDVANSIGVAETHYSTIETGYRQTNLRIAEKLAALYGIGVGDVLGLSGTAQPSFRTLPLLGTTQAGEWRVIVSDWDGETLPAVDFKGHPNAFYLRIEGDSMSPQIRHGDVVLIDPDLPVETNQVGLFVLDQVGTTVKRLQRDAGRVYLVADNQAFPPIDVGPDVHAIGRVLRVLRNNEVQ